MRNIVYLLIICLLTACKEEHPHYNGYIDADLTYLSSNYAGRLSDLLVNRGQSVNPHQLLFKLEQTSEQFNIEKSQLSRQNLLSQQQEIQDRLHYYDINYQRISHMHQQHAASQNDLDLAKRDLDISTNQLNAIKALVKNTTVDIEDKRWQATRKENSATDSGIIFDTYYNVGEYIQAGQPIVSLITQGHIKVIFYVSEAQLSQLFLDQKVNIISDGQTAFGTGKIRYISNVAQYTPPILYSREERASLVFRVEAGIDNPNLNQLHLGQPVTLEILS
jgi:HlyD family secretion protein